MPRYIDAEALKDVIQQHDYPLADRLNSVDNGMFTLGIFQAIDQMPTVSDDDDEVRGVGEWITTRTWEHDGDPYCSNCGFEQPYMRFEKFKFCPNCGAKMEVSEDA